MLQALRLVGKHDAGDLIILPKEFLQMVKEIYDDCAKSAKHFVRKQEYCEELRANKDYKQKYVALQVRDNAYAGLPVETVEQTVHRFLQEADEYVDIDEIIDFFTRKGRPEALRAQCDEEKEKSRNENIENAFKKDYSSSPDEEELRQKRRQRKLERLYGEKEALKQQGLDESETDKKRNRFGALGKSKDDDYKITVAEPFHFDSRPKKDTIAARRLQEWIAQKKEEEDKVLAQVGKFRANKVPKHVKDRKR